MSDVYIVGIDMIKFGRYPDRTVPSLAAEAALLALDDAGLGIKDMQALFCGNLGQASGMVGQRMLTEIGQTGIPVTNVANACATGATAFRDAWMSTIRSWPSVWSRWARACWVAGQASRLRA
jgi:acetyl-CoA acyltransferase